MATPPSISSLVREGLVSSEGTIDAEKLLQTLNQFITPGTAALSRGLTFSDNFASTVKDIRITMPSEASTWTEVPAPLANSWVHYGSPTDTPAYRMLPGGILEGKGCVKSGSGLATTVYTLPEGYRPGFEQTFPTVSGVTNVFGSIRIGTAGAVQALTGGSTAVFFLNYRTSIPSPAAPKVFTGTGWPLIIKHDLPQVRHVIATSCRSKGQSREESVGAFNPDWEDAGDGSIIIRAIWGLQWGKTYNIRFLMLAG